MCRLILALGQFEASAILRAAVAMSAGCTADHDGDIKVHPNGWGALWQDPKTGSLASHRDERPLFESWPDAPFAALDTRFLAVHSRHATLSKNQGLEFTHPLERRSNPPWYFMHNGFLPTVHARLGLLASRFDSLEYFDYIVPAGARRLDPGETLERLRAIPPGGSSGNAFAVTAESAYVIHWSPANVAAPRYFSMFGLYNRESTVIASERLPELGARIRWRPLPPEQVLEFPLKGAASAAS